MRFLAPLLLAFVLAGCALTPRQRWVQQREAITTTQDVSIELHKANVISDDAMLTADPFVKAARSHNSRAYLHLSADESQAVLEMDRADKQLGIAALYLGGVASDPD